MSMSKDRKAKIESLITPIFSFFIVEKEKMALRDCFILENHSILKEPQGQVHCPGGSSFILNKQKKAVLYIS